MPVPPSKSTTSLLARAAVLVACLAAGAASAQPAVPEYAMVISDEGAGLFCVPPGGSTAEKTAAIQLCLDWLESGAGRQELTMAVTQACASAGSNVAVCRAELGAAVQRGIALIEESSPAQIVASGDPLAGRALVFLPHASTLVTAPTNPALRGGTYVGTPGTATTHIGGSAIYPSYNIVYSTTGDPLTSYQDAAGGSHPIYAIFFGGPPPPIPALDPRGLAALATLVVVAGALAIAGRS